MHILGLALVLAFGVGQQGQFGRDAAAADLQVAAGMKALASVLHQAITPLIGPPCTPESFQCPNERLTFCELTGKGCQDSPAEPQVVPAVHEFDGHYERIGKDETPWCWPGRFGPELCQKERPGIWTCTDKSRALITSEDGNSHFCVRF